MATQCPNCGHRFIVRRFRASPRIQEMEKIQIEKITNHAGVITQQLILAAFPKWSKKTAWDVAANMIRRGVWAKVHNHKGMYVKIRDYIATPKGDKNRSSKKERMQLNQTEA